MDRDGFQRLEEREAQRVREAQLTDSQGEGGIHARQAAIACAAVAVLTYLASLRFDFVYDDKLQILNNPWLRSWSYLPRYFSQHSWAFSRPAAVGFWWRPLFLVWLRLNYWILGPHAMAWHATTIALHAAASAMVFLVARRLSGSLGAATVAGLIFAAHPAMIETAAWISGVPDSMAVILLGGALLLYIRGTLLAAVVLFATALLVKESSIVFPVALVALERIDCEGPISSQQRRKWTGAAVAFAAVSAVYLVARNYVLRGFTHPADFASLLHATETAPGLLSWYAGKLIVPWPISAHYDNRLVNQLNMRNFVLPLLVMVVGGIVIESWWRGAADSRRTRAAKFGTAWTLLFLLPAVYLPAVTRADFAHIRYLYLPMLGFSVVAGLAITAIKPGRIWRGLPVRQAAIVAAMVVVLGGLNLAQQVYWADDLVLSAHAAQVAPHNAAALTDYGVQLGSRGHLDRALPVLREAVRQEASNWYAVASLAYTEYALNLNVEAEAHFLRAVQLLPEPVEQYVYLGSLAGRLGKMDEAEWALREAIRRQPQTPRYHMALALVLEKEGKTAEARDAAQQELAIDPQASDARELLSRLGK